MGPQQPPQRCGVGIYGMGPYGRTPTLQSLKNPLEDAYNRLSRGSADMAEIVHDLAHQPRAVIQDVEARLAKVQKFYSQAQAWSAERHADEVPQVVDGHNVF